MYFLNAEGQIHHATIISKVDANMIYYTGNSVRRFDERLESTLGNGEKGALIIHLNDTLK